MKYPVFFRSPFRSFRRGFTLMEMLIVLSIIALLMGLVIYNLQGPLIEAKKAKAKGDILTLREALTVYQMSCGTLPTTEQGVKALWSKPTTEPIPNHWSAQMTEETKDPWQHSYQYVNPGKRNQTGYDLYSMGPDGAPNTDDDIGNWPDSTNASN